MLIASTNQKGGVGKSTLAVHLAVWLHDRGFKTALLDADVQRSSSRWLAQAEPTITIAVASTPEDCLLKARELTRLHEFVVADGPGGLNDISRTLLLLADLAIVPVTPSFLDVQSAQDATRLVHYARTLNQGRPAARLILNRFRLRETLSNELRDGLQRFEILSCEAVIRDLQVFRDAAQQGTVVTRLGKRHRGASEELTRLFEEIIAVGRQTLASSTQPQTT
jgi:chromosome partitioning protein